MGRFVVNDQYLVQPSAAPRPGLLLNVVNDTRKVIVNAPGAEPVRAGQTPSAAAAAWAAAGRASSMRDTAVSSCAAETNQAS